MIDESLLIDHRALALQPVFSGKYLSKIITLHGIYYSKLSPIELLKKACLRHHSTKDGRKAAAKKILNIKNKPPFLVSEEIGVFPTKSSKHPDCIWIFGHFFKAKKLDGTNTKLTFKNGLAVNVPVSLHVIQQQKLRLHMLLSHVQQSKRQYIFEQQLEVMERNTTYEIRE